MLNNVTTHYSFLKSIIKPEQLAKLCKELGYTSVLIADNNLSYAVQAYTHLKKQGIKTIFGCKFTIHDEKNIGQLLVVAKNLEGWKELIALYSRSNDPDMYHDVPTLTLEELARGKNLIVLTGFECSTIDHILWGDKKYTTVEEYQAGISQDYYSLIEKHLNKLVELFGDNVYLQIHRQSVKQKVISDILEGFTQVKHIPATECCFPRQEDHELYLIIQCIEAGIKMKDICPFLNKDYYIPSLAEFKGLCSDEGWNNLNQLDQQCESYNITSKPSLPKFEWTDGLSEDDYLRQLCRIGWTKKKTDLWDIKVYGDRVKQELEVFSKYGLAGYFLIVQDYVNWAKQQGVFVGYARGSSGGSLVAYLLGITELDPIPYKLLFSRFFNSGRCTVDNVEYPDIDVDFPVSFRESIIEYIKNRYGHDRVCQIVTFHRLQGRGALKEIFRVYDACSPTEANQVTENIYDEAKIAEKLEEDDEESILHWILLNEPKLLGDYCKLEDGVYSGEYASYFEKAIKLEGTYKGSGKHAAGLVIGVSALDKICPMMCDKSGNDKIASWEMDDLKKGGQVKFDILGVNSLDKSQSVKDILRNGRL